MAQANLSVGTPVLTKEVPRDRFSGRSPQFGERDGAKPSGATAAAAFWYFRSFSGK
jgi:hypothetical protein